MIACFYNIVKKSICNLADIEVWTPEEGEEKMQRNWIDPAFDVLLKLDFYIWMEGKNQIWIWQLKLSFGFNILLLSKIQNRFITWYTAR